MKDFFSTVKFKILLCVLVVLAGIMAWAGANNRLTAAPQELLGAILTPFQKIAALGSGGLADLWEKYTSIDSIVAENEALEEENAELRRQLVDYEKLQAENQAFRDLYQIQQEHPEYTYASAFVIGRDALDQFGSFTIDLGTTDGVKKGDVVVSDKGYLVGRVTEANLTSSKVLTILSPSFNAAAIISRTRDNGILSGSADYVAQGQCTLNNLTRDTLASVGDEVITTGLGGEIPADILVGTVDQLVPEVSGQSTIAVVQPGADILSLTHVFVITDETE